MIHDLKTDPAYFQRLVDGTKTFEVRKDDRGYQPGDTLVLREWSEQRCRDSFRCRIGTGAHLDNCSGFTGRVETFRVGFVFKAGFGVDLGRYVVLSLLAHAEDVS